jgi:hypothetical protein
MISTEFMNLFRENIQTWKNKIGINNKFIKIYCEYINNPEG